jgi:hypothetical protein
MKTRHSQFMFQREMLGLERFLTPALALAASAVPLHARAQAGADLPVYQVVQNGATATQAATLADALHLPPGALAQTNGLASYVDPAGYLSVPTTSLTDPTITSNLLANTRNLYPSIPISIRALDFSSLSNLTILDDATALNSINNALASAGLSPGSASPVIGHRNFVYYFTNENGIVVSNTQPLDTTVRYQFTLGSGYPLVGPGAQVQVSYGGGNVTRLLYANRQLQPGSLVQLVPPNIASNRLAAMFPPGAVLAPPEIVYWSPPFLPVSGAAGDFQPTTLIPWYSCRGTLNVASGPATGQGIPVHLKPRMIPATDDPNFVPTATLTISNSAPGQVTAYATVTGGTPPYTFLWSCSDPSVSSNNGPAISYSPHVRVPMPPLRISAAAGGQLTIAWPASPFNFQLETASFLPPIPLPPIPTQWTPVNVQVLSDGDSDYVTVQGDLGGSAFFRLRLVGGTVQLNDTVGLTVVDRNGVSSSMVSGGIVVQANPDRAPKAGPPVISWGTESPFEPGGFAVDRIGWQNGMGIFGGGGGIQMFCWTGSTAWPGDFIEPPTPGTLPAKPWVNGCADFSNWGVNTASIVLNNCDGASDFFTSSQPGATVDQYNSSGLAAPIDPWTVVINLYQGANTASTQVYKVNYDYSWGPLGPNGNLNWLCMDCCNALDFYGANNLLPGQRWGKAFGGLHILTGFDSEEAVADGTFERDFGWFMLVGGLPLLNLPPLSVVQSWFAAGEVAGIDSHGVPAVLGPLGKGGAFNEYDYYWGKGSVGPTIPPSQIAGWWTLEDH